MYHNIPPQALIAAPYTPLTADFSVDYDKVPPMIDFLISNGVQGAFVCGSTGEGPSLTIDERKRIFSIWAGHVPDEFVTIAMVGGNNQPEAIELAKHARDCGIQAISIVAPSYFNVHSVAYLVEYCLEIAARVPEMPVYYYHIPGLSGVNVSMLEFLKIADGRFPNLTGIKYSHSNLMELYECKHFAGGKYNMLWGRDEELLAALAMGADGAVGSTYNYHTPVYQRMIDAFRKGDITLARKYQGKAVEAIRILINYGGIAAGKGFMKVIGMDCGPTRPPIPFLSDAELTAMEKEIRETDFFEFASKP